MKLYHSGPVSAPASGIFGERVPRNTRHDTRQQHGLACRPPWAVLHGISSIRDRARRRGTAFVSSRRRRLSWLIRPLFRRGDRWRCGIRAASRLAYRNMGSKRCTLRLQSCGGHRGGSGRAMVERPVAASQSVFVRANNRLPNGSSHVPRGSKKRWLARRQLGC